MLKFGICTAAEDTPGHRLWRRGLIAATLLPTTSPSPLEIVRFERIMAQLRLSNGTVRTTFRNRLAAVDEKVDSLLPRVFPLHTALSVEDWAVSGGMTAADWFRSLRRLYRDLVFVASDLLLYLVEVRREKERDAFVVEPSGDPIQYIRPPFVVSLTEMQHPIYFINRAVQRRALREWRRVSKCFRIPAEWDSADGWQTLTLDSFVLRRLPLVHPDVMKMQSERFRIKQHSVFTPLSQPVHVIRTMNILNRSYVQLSQLQAAAEAVRQSLRPGGLWIIGRTVTDNPPNHDVTVLQNTSDGLRPILRMGSGSELEAIIEFHKREVSNV